MIIQVTGSPALVESWSGWVLESCPTVFEDQILQHPCKSMG
jgi:hypothetical protein